MNIEELIKKLIFIKENCGSDVIVEIQNGDDGGEYNGSRKIEYIDSNDVVMNLSNTIIIG